MHRITRSALTLALAGLACAPTAAWAAATPQTRTVAPFSALAASGDFEVVAKVGGAQSVKLIGDPTVLSQVTATSQGGTLKLDLSLKHTTWRTLFHLRQYHVRCEVGVPSLKALSMSGACSADVSGLKGDRFDLHESGACHATLHGAIKALSANLSGACSAYALGLTAQTAEVDASGASTLALKVSKKITGSLNGDCTLTYQGRPTLSVSTSGVSTVKAK